MLPPNLQWIANEFPDLQNLNPIGQGGQKLVVSATHPTDGEVVIKLVNPLTQNPEEIRREIGAVSQIASPRVPRVIDVGIVNSPMGQVLWVREQRVEGISLRQYLANGPLTAKSVLTLGSHLMEVLEEAEKAHIVHRDIKPDNIMVDATDGYWLLDFGISRHLSMTPVTPQTRPFGKFTLGYAPPEQVRNLQSEIDSTADLFALGVTFHEAATGQHPFRHGAANDFEILNRVDNLALAPLRLPINEPDSFADLVSAMVQKRRHHRPRTVQRARVWLEDIMARQ